MKILLISDTHGTNIDRISAYAAELDADLCIHAGDCRNVLRTDTGESQTVDTGVA